MSFSILFKVALKSLAYRRNSIIIAMTAITLSVFLLLSLEHLRHSAKRSFNGTVAGVDLIAGPRSSDLNLLLTTVYRMGAPTHNMSWESVERFQSHRNVSWVVPIALGDSHRGFRVVGTQDNFFKHYKTGQSRDLDFAHGKAFKGVFEVVLGSHVARNLGYNLGDQLVIAHGIAEASFQKHDKHPFTVVGVLAPTGTPVDNALYVSLSDLEAIHLNRPVKDEVLIPASVTAVFLGLNSKLATFKVQREIKNTREEALSAIIPGVALTQLWQITRGMETTLQFIGYLVLVSSLLGLAAVLLATVRERRDELKVFRALGAGPLLIFILVELEAMFVALMSCLLAIVGLIAGIFFTSDGLMYEYGIDLGGLETGLVNLELLGYVLGGTVLMAALPALLSYRSLRLN